MKTVDITKKALQSSVERFPVYSYEAVDKDQNLRMEHAYAFEMGAKWMENYTKVHLTQYTDFLLKEGYCDSDVYDEPPTAIDLYLKLER